MIATRCQISFSRQVVKIVKNFFSTQPCKKVGILGVPFHKGQTKVGVADGPDAIRKFGLLEQLKEHLDYEGGNFDIKDYGDILYEISKELQEKIVTVPNMKAYGDVASCNYEVSKNVQNILKEGRTCITLGGDHSLGVGTVDAHLKVKNQEVAVLWVDAHPDLNTNKTSGSGNIHGMPMALLVKELADYWPYLPGMDWQKPVLPLKNIAYIGLRSVDIYERLVIEKSGMNAFGMEDIENLGINNVVNMALSKIDPDNNKSIHVSFDIDSLDPLEAPSTGCPIRGGLTLREGVQLLETVYKTGRLNALDLVEVNPHIGSESEVKRTIEAAVHIILAALGYSRKGVKLNKSLDLPLQTFPPTQAVIS